ncbi:MAG: GIY-YIG nuclease family protein [Flavobacterium sp.]
MPCKKCRQDGHNSRTCKVILESSVSQELVTVNETPLPLPASIPLQVPAKRYYCYILGQSRHIRSGMGRTYNGYTVDLIHRLRQHNGEIKGGAVATKGVGPWEFIAVMTCMDWTSVRAMKVEWLIRYPTRKKPRPSHFAGAQGRINSLSEVVQRMPERSIKLYVHPRFYDSVKLPDHVELYRTMEPGF